MFCVKCGAKSSDEFDYCTNCGAKLKKETDISDSSLTSAEDANNIVYATENKAFYENQVQGLNSYRNYNQPQYNPQFAINDENKFSRMSIAGFVLSCCSFLTDEIGIICAVLALIFSIIGLTGINKIKRRGKGLAIAGIALSGAYIALFIYFIIFYILLFAGNYLRIY